MVCRKLCNWELKNWILWNWVSLKTFETCHVNPSWWVAWEKLYILDLNQEKKTYMYNYFHLFDKKDQQQSWWLNTQNNFWQLFLWLGLPCTLQWRKIKTELFCKVRPAIHTILSRKQSFLETSFKREEFENTGFLFWCGQKTFLINHVIEIPDLIFPKHKSKTTSDWFIKLSSSGIVWMETF